MNITARTRELKQADSHKGETHADVGSSGPVISVTGLSKRFERPGGEEVMAIDNISIDVNAGELVVLLGPSGCGKTTLLRCLAGLESPDQGEITLEGRAVYSSAKKIDIPVEKRNAAMLFQSYALWPHLSVFDNVAYPLKTGRKRKISKIQLSARVAEVLDIVNCGNLTRQYPGEISGGQQQRVALARAIASDEPVVYFDEPLSNIDSLLRDKLRIELKDLQRKVGFSAIYVTHDQQEALTLADRVVVLRTGKIAQIGTPREVFEKPNSAYVARFMGSVNEVVGTVSKVVGDQTHIKTDIGVLEVDKPNLPLSPGDKVIAMCRPALCQVFESADRAPKNSIVVEGVVRDQIFLGTRTEVRVDVGQHTLVAWAQVNANHTAGQRVYFSMPHQNSFVVKFDADTTDSLTHHDDAN